MYNAPVIRKAFEVLRFIIEKNRSLGVTEISNDLDLSKSTVFGILKSLQDMGFITKNKATKRYAVGQELYKLSKKVLQGGMITTLARPYLERLSELVEESVFLCARDNNTIKVIETVETSKKMKISTPIGSKFPITSSAFGKAFLSPMGNDEIRSFLTAQGLPKYTQYSITDIDRFIAEIEKTRQTGYSVDIEEYLVGVNALASLVHANGIPSASLLLCIIGFAGSITEDRIDEMARYLLDTTKEISEQLS